MGRKLQVIPPSPRIAQVEIGPGHPPIVFAQFSHFTDEADGGITLQSNIRHPCRGASFFFCGAHADAIREALGLNEPPPMPQREPTETMETE